MQTPLQISWEHIDSSEFIEGRIRREVAALERLFGRITSCRVAVEGRSHRQNKGGLYAVRIQLALPGCKEIDATRTPPSNQSHENAYVAVRDAFQAVKRQLRDRLAARADSVTHPETR